ncbi:ATP-binding protein [Paenibacillus alkalitolerans]|uniref:ATP-binding protein n=1 Tax=Paenibacillus alkalitolerans TaxID=2799335 RepID=UPI0018F668D8|nr:ATP-binding protein [Paenibacillus alkalitolerans]
MLRELFVNAAILICGLYIGSQLFRHSIVPQSPRWPRIYYGCFLGLIGSVLIHFHANIGELPIDFSIVLVLLASIYCGWSGSITAAVVTGSTIATIGQFTSHVSFNAVIPLVTAVIGCLLAQWNVHRFVQWSAMVLIAFILQSLAVVLQTDNYENLWTSLPLYGLSLASVAFAADTFVRYDNSRRILATENTYLTQHDLLTGLLNFQTFQSRLQQLLANNRNLLFVLIDCDDVKSLNTEQGFHTVDGTLRNVANLLRVCFPDALIMGRYGSDEFAVVIPKSEGITEVLHEALEQQIPKQADIQLSFGYAVYPDEEKDPIAFVTLVQRRLLESKRRLWLQREAHWLHSERLKAVGELAAAMAHEIRNPLTTVKGFLQVSRKSNYNIASYYDIIMHEIKRMSELTAEFLQFSKPVVHSPKLIPLQDCVLAGIQLTESDITSHGHHLHIVAEEEPLYAWLDKDKMVQVLLNVIRNGIEAMDESGALTIAVARRGEYGIIEIADTGRGIPENHLDRLFQPFFSTKSKGTGLGLSICQRIVSEHGGYISVRSKVGVGTSFTIRLPLAPAEEQFLT